MGNAIKTGGGGSTKIVNGVINEYLASTEDVDANMFVEFVSSYGDEKVTALKGDAISAVLLPNGNVFIAHSDSSYCLNGIVCTISGTEITFGTDTLICSTHGTACQKGISAVLLPNGNVFILHSRDITNKYLNGIVCTISGTEITVGTDTQISAASYSANTFSPVLLPNGNIFIPYTYGSSYYLYCMIININETVITVQSNAVIDTAQYSGFNFSAVLLPNGNVFILHTYGGSSYYLSAVICTISGTTVTVGTGLSLSSQPYSGYVLSALSLPNGNVFIAHSYDNTNYKLYVQICTINGTTITAGSQNDAGGNVQYPWALKKMFLLPNNMIYIPYQHTGNNKYLYEAIFKLKNLIPIIQSNSKISSASYNEEMSSIVLPNGSVFIAHNSATSILYGIVRILKIKSATNSIEPIDGFTITKCTTTTSGKVWTI